MVNHSKCPLCSSPELSLKFEVRDNFVTGEIFPLAVCKNCGFLFTREYPEENEMEKYYDSGSYISHSNTSEGIVSRLYKIIRRVMLRKKTSLVRRFTGKSTGNILDVGCGTGHFLNAMKEKGWQATGIEINKGARDFAVSEFGLNVFQSVDDVPPDLKFDCITLWHVLEHFHRPDEYISKLKKLLRAGGILIVALPNSGSCDARHYKEAWAAYDVPRHLWHFTPETFFRFSQKKGLSMAATRYLPFDVFYISILSEKYRKSKVALISGLIKGVYFSFLSMLNRARTSSVIYILK